jgi:hypothetical protein
MALPVTIPNEFANATASIPLSQLDTNFNTLANAVNGISDGSETLANVTATVANITTANVGALNTSGAVVFNDAGADVDFRVEGDTDANLLFVDASADAVGIGTSSPTSKLDVRGSATNFDGLRLINTEGSSGIITTTSLRLGITNSVGIRNTKIQAIESDADSNSVSLAFFVNNANALDSEFEAGRFDSSGNLLVGLTSPTSAERLSVWRDNVTTSPLVANIQNQAAISTTRVTNTLLRVSSNANGADAAVQFTDNTANNYWYGGNNGGAYVVANSNGVRLSNGGTSWASDSDERLKDILEPIINAAEKVSSLRAVIGKYKTDKEGVRRTFLIAQDVQAVLPEAVFDEQGTLMLAYTETIPLLVAAIQELKAELDTVKAELATLKGN